MTLTGKHLIAGEWTAGKTTFRSEPASGEPHDFSVGTPNHVEAACAAAEGPGAEDLLEAEAMGAPDASSRWGSSLPWMAIRTAR